MRVRHHHGLVAIGMRGFLLGWIVWLLAAPALGAPYAGVYDQLIATTAARYGLDPTLVQAVIQCESQFNPLAQSPRGAQGLMQLMPATQTLLGVRDAFDPQDNVEAGVAYLAILQRTFPDNVSLLLAAYNAGPQAVVQAGNSVPPIAETQRYVQCVLRAQETYRQSGLFPPIPHLGSSRDQPEARGPLRVLPLRLSRQVARQGKLITVQLEASHSSLQRAHGLVMLYYPAHLVSLAALHSPVGETAVAFPASPMGQATPADTTATYQLLRTAWPAWQPGKWHRAVIALIPRSRQDLMLYLSVVLEPAAPAARPLRWGAVVRIPVQRTP
jgi:transglycosylase-like protein with SLT domain